MVTIRVLQANDFAMWNNLWQQYLVFYETSLPEEVTLHTWQRLTENSNTAMLGLGVFVDGVLQGFTHLVLHPNTWSTQPCCYLEDLFVSPDHRSQGLGKTLIKAAQQIAIEQNCCRLYWVTAKDNHHAQIVYDQLATQTNFIQYKINL
ncbi:MULTISPECIES: GNAT family N-acetyltransferase [Vitreoscilla]|uniref:GNAT family N-acetyltransferase n=1 Tax=Vitreoscilla stercoraria TaxID=61 RepID=A0ABY4EA29_VITST|nr:MULTISPECIES: GNAT family N-acetyltransferase [Vitreoscilla]AUZ06008.1 acyl-CoA N-acyltransferase [Vitreoscilla sp. C1]UOO92620.1 GNAT family N-acetyltransferase [Vitreoscilla stercoraria]